MGKDFFLCRRENFTASVKSINTFIFTTEKIVCYCDRSTRRNKYSTSRKYDPLGGGKRELYIQEFSMIKE